MVLLVVASPCAVVASIMPALLSAISSGARNGVLMKGGTYLEKLSKVKAVAFDKTGTITKGEPEVTDFETVIDDENILQNILAIEKQSSHPLARAIVSFAETRGSTRQVSVQSTEDIPGQGVRAVIGDNVWMLGNERLIEKVEVFPDLLRKKRELLQSEGKTVVYVAKDDKLVAVIGVKDQIRPEAKALIQFLNQQGVKQS